MNDGGQQAWKCRFGYPVTIRRHGIAMGLAIVMFGAVCMGGWAERVALLDRRFRVR